jgi:hypothetical protein
VASTDEVRAEPPANEAGKAEGEVTRPAATTSPLSAIGQWRGTRILLIGLVLGVVPVAGGLLLRQHSPAGAFIIAAETGVLTVEPLCGDRLIWDLPAGLVTARSSPPHASEPGGRASGLATLVLEPGASARVQSMAAGVISVSVSHVENVQDVCAKGGAPFYEMTVAGTTLAHDENGVTYGAVHGSAAQAAQPPVLALPLAGRVVIGDIVPLGAGWEPDPTGMMETATVDLRVKPWFDENRVTLRTERLERGSLLDTHACLAPRDTACPGPDASSARGFLRTRAEGGMTVQLYSGEAIGAQSLGGDQYVIEIPRVTAALQSTALKSVASVLVVVFALYQGIRMVWRDSLSWWRRKARITGRVLLLLVAASPAYAEPVEVRQGTFVGAGYSFRRGASCLVVTARHVVSQMGVPVAVLDRTGARAEGSRAYDNEFYDLSIVTLPETSLVACSATWPDVAWLTRATFSSRNEFRAVRHYATGRETIVRLQHAGGVKHLLTLAPVDKLTIRESDSGAIVELDGRPVGIVQSIDTATDRVNVLRFDTIDQLVGDRFKGATTGPVSYVGVLSRGRPNPLWSTYVQSWLTEKAGRAVLPAAATPNRAAPSVCEVKVDVLAWERMSVPNPAYSAVELQLKSCGRRGFIFEQACQAGRRAAATTPRTLLSHKVTLNSTVTPPNAPPVSKLETTTHVPPSSRTLGRTEIDMMVLQAAAGSALQDLLGRAPCP